MGVYIKSMEMPKCCDSCDFYDIIIGEKPFCALTTKSGGIAFNPCKGKMKDCPLVEVKTPHGRLIDADALDLHDEEERAHNEVVEVVKDSGCGSPTHLYYSAFYDGLLTVTSKIRFAPSLIEEEANT